VLEALFGEEGVDEAEDGPAVGLAELLDVAELPPEPGAAGGLHFLDLGVADEVVHGDLEGAGEAGEQVHRWAQGILALVVDANRRTQVALRNGVTMDYAYDGAGQLTGITYRNGAGPLGDLTYSYDPAGRVIHVGGSLAKVNLPSAMSGAVYNASNQLTTWNGASRSYVLNGNLVSDGTRTFTWNARGELAAIASAARRWGSSATTPRGGGSGGR
jgi:YD repeat-containing protein